MHSILLCVLSAALMVSATRRPVVIEPRSRPPVVIPEPRVFQATKASSCAYQLAFQAAGQYAYLQSPNFPEDYPPNVDCSYALTSPAGTEISLECTEFNVESASNCPYDIFSVSLTGDRYMRDASRTCGRGTFDIQSSTNAMHITFKSDGGNPWSRYPYRFQCKLSAVQVSPPAPTTSAPATTTTSQSSPSTCECGSRNEVERIVGGEYADVNEFPWRCGLYNPNMGIFCGASIINNEWIMTAAHCTDALPAGASLQVNCGDHDLTSATEATNVLIDVVQIIEHPQYNDKTQDNDMALLKLKTPLTYNKDISPICLPWNMVGKSLDDLTVTASGWGTTSSGGSQSYILKKVDLPTLDTSSCRQYYGTAVTNNMMCTYQPQSDTCQGDSGGSIDYKDPATGRYMALGVVSWGAGCADEGAPGVYAKVTNYLSWIESTTGGTYCKA